jgi:transcription initiation factor TFIID subunit 5
MFSSSGNENSWTSAQAFNKAGGDLKLGPMPMSDDLKMETERVMREQAMIDPSTQYDQMYLQQSVPGLVNPATSDLLPHPPVFKTMDVRREIERIRDARKRIRLEPAVLNGVDINSQQATMVKSRALPSICAYTLHEVGEG